MIVTVDEEWRGMRDEDMHREVYIMGISLLAYLYLILCEEYVKRGIGSRWTLQCKSRRKAGAN